MKKYRFKSWKVGGGIVTVRRFRSCRNIIDNPDNCLDPKHRGIWRNTASTRADNIGLRIDAICGWRHLVSLALITVQLYLRTISSFPDLYPRNVEPVYAYVDDRLKNEIYSVRLAGFPNFSILAVLAISIQLSCSYPGVWFIKPDQQWQKFRFSVL